LHNTNWDDMRFFLALCREGSVTGAGRSLGVNHTTVARRINALEDNLGTRLFDHSRDGYEMTQAAENMYEHARRMEEITQAIDRDVFGQDAELKGPLKITVAHDVAERLVVPRLREFRAAYPCIDLDILTTTGLVDLAAREADIALRLTAKPPDYLIGREVVPMRHGVYGSPDCIRTLDEQPHVILFRSEPEQPEWVRQHFPGAEIAMRVDDVGTMGLAVANHMGLARMPCYVGDSLPEIRRLALELKPSTWGIWILSHVDLRSTARVRVAREFLIDVIEKQRDLILGEKSRYFDERGG
jgi:DNA-binding transcriptional LysR family regulator